MSNERVETIAITGSSIRRQFERLISEAEGGELYIVTPFINDLEIRRRDLTSHLNRQVRNAMSISLMVAPPDLPHRPNAHKNLDELLKCYKCRKPARKIKLLDVYFQFVNDLLIKDNLHGKVYLAKTRTGKRLCLTGSVNLTRQAFKDLWEIGIYTSNQNLIRSIAKIVTRWQGPDRHRGARAQPYLQWKRSYYREYPHLIDIVKAL